MAGPFAKPELTACRRTPVKSPGGERQASARGAFMCLPPAGSGLEHRLRRNDNNER